MTPGPAGSHALGLDVGSVSVSVVELGPDDEVLQVCYALHHGDPAATLGRFLGDVELDRTTVLGATTSTPPRFQVDRCYDNQVCLIRAVRRFHPDARSILVVGGERFGLVRLDEEGEYLSFKANSPCAAGTGGFLDQQARRLNLDGGQPWPRSPRPTGTRPRRSPPDVSCSPRRTSCTPSRRGMASKSSATRFVSA